MEYLDTLFVVFCGSCIGAIIGAGMPSQVERKSGGRATRWQIFSNVTALGILLNELIQLVVVGVIVAIVGVSILRLGGAYPLSNFDGYVLVSSLFVAAAVAKWMRYRRWKRRRLISAEKT